ncbi:uncharacterized protein A1O9_12518 [Exophiala aquamarina CBS 119918]|uniref:Uncharacterized protein n=1 Tax=Exophiala aquamarina CBS 119918 TaxID=1182545 RepID=A0A072NU35_9EURO|nr:uncharacterized protein A1O9_12518 [Exophiala aquamarina CBS 119918]KEF51369.1 hypothetical protein A1O9_12518 [Exophiala aquamarina CBS 119918]
MAVVGQFKLSVHIASLPDSGMIDARMLSLFQSLRAGDLVLLDDIDCAGLGRETQQPVQNAVVCKEQAIVAKRQAKKPNDEVDAKVDEKVAGKPENQLPQMESRSLVSMPSMAPLHRQDTPSS